MFVGLVAPAVMIFSGVSMGIDMSCHIYIYLVGGLNPSEKYDDSIFHRENDYIPKLVFPH